MRPRRLAMLAACVIVAALVMAGSSPRHRALGRRVIVLGFDGLDFTLTKDLLDKGRLPNFAKLAERGGFSQLGTSIPPQSPVAWSSFITGLDPGGHGIFDFVHRDPKTLVPFLSTTKTEPGGRSIKVGRWQFPLSSGKVELLRRGHPFWGVLEAHRIESTIVRMPANFPPSGEASRELSGMGTPDLLGTYGTFSFYTSGLIASGQAGPVAGGVIHQVDIEDDVVHGTLEGPDNPFLRRPEKVHLQFTAFLDAERRFAKLVVGEEERLLRVGEWSDWIPIDFELIPSQHL